MTSQEKIKELLTRGVTNVIEKKHLETALKSRKKLRVKYGIDPTGPKVHIGHAITFWKLRKFQELGHKVVLIIGDFTAQIGDPSDKEAERQPLSMDQVKENLKGYLDQVEKIIDLKKAELHYNTEWHNKASEKELINESAFFTVNQMIKRDNFWKRFQADKPISIREFLYPLLQGKDSVEIRADIEIGGNDQYFNLLSGRTMQKNYGQKEQDILTFELLLGTDGRKMSKTYQNSIWLEDSANEMFGKVMSIKDELIIQYFTLATDAPMKEIEKIEKELEKGLNPRDAKARLATEIVTLYHGKAAAKKAADSFTKQFAKKETPDEIPEIKLAFKVTSLVEILVTAGLASSKTNARQLIEQGGVKVDGAVIGEREAVIEPIKGMIIQVGKRKFVRIK